MKKDEHLLSITELKNILKQRSRESLIDLPLDCYKINSQVKEYITAKYAGQDTMEQIFEAYKNKVHDVFFPRSMSAQFKIGEARKAVNDFKKICSDEKLVIDLMLYYVEMGVEFTNTYGDISESVYNSVESMYQSVIDAINKHKNPVIFNMLSKRLKAVVDDTDGIGWGFHDSLNDMYHNIKWLDAGNIDVDLADLGTIKSYISSRLDKRKDLPGIEDSKLNIEEITNRVIDADEIFLDKMDKQGRSYSNDEEYDFIAKKTGFATELIELILWQRYCCPKCGSTNTLNIIYGMPAPEAIEASRRDEVILGGCSVLLDSPLHICRDCNYEWEKYCEISILPSIIYIKAYVGGFLGPNCSIEADAINGKLKRSYTHCDQEEFIDDETDIAPEAWKGLLRALKNCDFEYWVDKYEDPHICDGTQWSVEVQLDTGRKIIKYGSNMFPGRWKQFCRAMSKLAGVPFG